MFDWLLLACTIAITALAVVCLLLMALQFTYKLWHRFSNSVEAQRQRSIDVNEDLSINWTPAWYGLIAWILVLVLVLL
jgi:cell division protein FtsX